MYNFDVMSLLVGEDDETNFGWRFTIYMIFITVGSVVSEIIYLPKLAQTTDRQIDRQTETGDPFFHTLGS